MRVAILGTGGIGLGYAALLAANGHSPVLWSPTGGGVVAPGGRVTVTGVIPGAFVAEAAASCAAAVAGAEVVIIAVNGVGHRAVMDALAPALNAGQMVIVSAQLSCSAAYLAGRLAARGVVVPVAAWATTAVTARRVALDRVHISGVRQRLDVATFPARLAEGGLASCRALFGDRFEARSDLLAITLSNLNPPVHLANMLCNLTRAERGENWSNYGSITPAVARLIEALDGERLALAVAFGVTVRSVHEHVALSFGVERGPLGGMMAEVYRLRPELAGPATLDTRFITEDVPFGLVPLAFLARRAGVAVQLHDAGIALAGALYGRDFAGENDLLPHLGFDGCDAARIHALLRG
jgi:opine dehydrogenase